MNGISKLLSIDGFIPVNKTLIKKLGLHEAIILGELCSEYNYWEQQDKLEDDMFYSTRDNIEENTGLNEHYQRKALKTLQDSGIITVKRKGIPAVNYYKIDFDKILILLSARCESREHLEVNPVDLNNNKQTKIKEQNNNSKELLQTPEFSFGKQKTNKQNLYTKCVSLIDSYDFADLRNLLIDYLNYRLSVKDKPLYANMWKGMLNKLAEMNNQKAVIQQSLERGYLSFYPVSNGSYAKDYDVRKGKPWEEGLSCEQYTEEELAELDALEKEREAKGMRTRF